MMRLPSKVTSYKNSTFAKFPEILSILKEQDMRPRDLYQKVKKRDFGITEYIEVLDCLFMLGKIELLPDQEVLHYVG